jgi:hypothetical protein
MYKIDRRPSRVSHPFAKENVNLWYTDTLVVYNRRLKSLHPTAAGSSTFLESSELAH